MTASRVLLALLFAPACVGDNGGTLIPEDPVAATYSENPGADFVGFVSIEATNFAIGDTPGDYLEVRVNVNADVGGVSCSPDLVRW